MVRTSERPGTATRYPRATSRGRRVRPGEAARNGTVNLTDKEGARLVARHDVLRGGAPARGAALLYGDGKLHGARPRGDGKLHRARLAGTASPTGLALPGRASRGRTFAVTARPTGLGLGGQRASRGLSGGFGPMVCWLSSGAAWLCERKRGTISGETRHIAVPGQLAQ